MGDWQPIETAPKDGTQVLVFRRAAPVKRMYGIDCRHPSQYGGAWVYSRQREQPTHWMPLPSPPGWPAAPLQTCGGGAG